MPDDVNAAASRYHLRIRLHQTSSLDVEVYGDDETQRIKFEDLATASLRFKVLVLGSTTIPELLSIVRRQFDAMVDVRIHARSEGIVVGDRTVVVEESCYIESAIVRDVHGDQILPPFTVSDLLVDNDLLHVIVAIPLEAYQKSIQTASNKSAPSNDAAGKRRNRKRQASPTKPGPAKETTGRQRKRKNETTNVMDENTNVAVIEEPSMSSNVVISRTRKKNKVQETPSVDQKKGEVDVSAGFVSPPSTVDDNEDARAARDFIVVGRDLASPEDHDGLPLALSGMDLNGPLDLRAVDADEALCTGASILDSDGMGGGCHQTLDSRSRSHSSDFDAMEASDLNAGNINVASGVAEDEIIHVNTKSLALDPNDKSLDLHPVVLSVDDIGTLDLNRGDPADLSLEDIGTLDLKAGNPVVSSVENIGTLDLKAGNPVVLSVEKSRTLGVKGGNSVVSGVVSESEALYSNARNPVTPLVEDIETLDLKGGNAVVFCAEVSQVVKSLDLSPVVSSMKESQTLDLNAGDPADSFVEDIGTLDLNRGNAVISPVEDIETLDLKGGNAVVSTEGSQTLYSNSETSVISNELHLATKVNNNGDPTGMTPPFPQTSPNRIDLPHSHDHNASGSNAGARDAEDALNSGWRKPVLCGVTVLHPSRGTLEPRMTLRQYAGSFVPSFSLRAGRVAVDEASREVGRVRDGGEENGEGDVDEDNEEEGKGLLQMSMR
ncbi:hypothetical protein HDU67_004345, partial [Dinochytrium kinnereticum]